jgi:hypothetical protein
MNIDTHILKQRVLFLPRIPHYIYLKLLSIRLYIVIFYYDILYQYIHIYIYNIM